MTKQLISDQHIFGNMPFAELMQYIIDYKRTGRWPFEGMSKNKKSEFRRKSRQFRLMDNGDLMRVVFKEGVPTGVYFFPLWGKFCIFKLAQLQGTVKSEQ